MAMLEQEDTNIQLKPPVQCKIPKVGKRRELVVTLQNGCESNVLIDSGSPTSLIQNQIVQQLELRKYRAPPLQFKGAVSEDIAFTNNAVTLRFEYQQNCYEVAAYVTEDISVPVIVGNPIIEEHPELITTTGDNDYHKDTTLEIAFIDTENLKRKLDNTDEFWVLQVNEIVEATADTLHVLPKWLRNKYKEIIRNDLPTKKKQAEDMVQHEVNLKTDGRLPHLQPYRLTPKTEKILQAIIKDLLEKRFITPSTSPCSSPIVLVKKKDGSYRMCVDYRRLNEATIKDPFPLPHIESLLTKIGDAKVFSTLDLHSGYHQIPMRQEDKYKTAFVTPNGKYEYTVMPFGLVNAPSTFARYMADLFRDLPFVCVYLDDILIFSGTIEEHWHNLDITLGRLANQNLIVKQRKCQFAQRKVEFLGYVIEPNGIRPVQAKCEAIKRFPSPNNVKMAQRFLGMINYYRKFIPGCSRLARPITEFIMKKAEWNEPQEKAFQDLKRYLMKEPVLVPYKENGQYRLTTDASTEGIGAVLEEIDGKNVIGTVSYFSKSLEKAQKNYPAGELELLGVVLALEHFRYVLQGRKFLLRTDHISLLALKNWKEPCRRISTWLDKLAEYDFDFQYVKGDMNVVADAISRAEYVEEVNEVRLINDLSEIDPRTWKDELSKDSLGSAVLQLLGTAVTYKVPAAERSGYEKFCVMLERAVTWRNKFSFRDGILWYQERVVVPKGKQEEVLSVYHDDSGHFGEATTYRNIAHDFYWPNMKKIINKYVKTCVRCQVMKAHQPKRQGLLTSLPIPEGRWTSISIDFMTGLPMTKKNFDMIMVVVDRFSKRCHLIACEKSLKGIEVIDLLFRFVFAYHGFPRVIVSDRDARFTSQDYQEALQRVGIKHNMSSSNHPQTDGQTERCIQVINRLLRTYTIKTPLDWDLWLPLLEFTYNNNYNTAIRNKPFEIDLGYTPNPPMPTIQSQGSYQNMKTEELKQHLHDMELTTQEILQENQINTETSKNKGRRELLLAVGEFVWIHKDAYFNTLPHRKLLPMYTGPFEIITKVNDNAYELKMPDNCKHPVVNIQWLKKCELREDEFRKKPPRTKKERINRLNEVMNIVAFDKKHKHFYCQMTDVDPRSVVEYSLAELSLLPKSRRTQLMTNFNNLMGTRTNSNEEEREDVMQQHDRSCDQTSIN